MKFLRNIIMLVAGVTFVTAYNLLHLGGLNIATNSSGNLMQRVTYYPYFTRPWNSINAPRLTRSRAMP